MKEPVGQKILYAYFENRATPLEKLQIKEWLKEEGSEEIFYHYLASWEARNLQVNPDLENAFAKYKHFLSGASNQKPKIFEKRQDRTWLPAGKLNLKRSDSIHLLKIAASLLFVLSISFYAYRNLSIFKNADVALKKIETLKGERTRVELSDGSFAYLNASSSLIFPETFSESTRTVELIGEAFFEVVKNPSKPFIVKTKDFQTVVLGTSFNVRAFDAEAVADVALVTGKVRVTSEHPIQGDALEHLLVPGERLIYNKANGSFGKQQFDVADITGWKDGVLVFNDTDFPGVIEKLEQWYGIEITVIGKPSEQWHVAGHFDNESLVDVLNSIQFVYDIEYKINDNNLTLKCN